MYNDIQLENGYTRIANEILEILAMTKINGTQFRIIFTVFRYTYGFQRIEHKLSVSFIANATGTHIQQLKKELNDLIEKNILTVKQEATYITPRIIAFNKNYSTWNIKSYQAIDSLPGSELTTSLGSELTTSSGSESTSQERKHKEIIKECSIKEKFTNSTNLIKYDDYFEQVWKLYPCKKGKSAVSKNSKKLIYETGIEKMTKAIENYKQELKQNTWKQPMNGSTFFNGRYEDYLPVAVQEEVAVSKGKIILLSDEDIAGMNRELKR